MVASGPRAAATVPTRKAVRKNVSFARTLSNAWMGVRSNARRPFLHVEPTSLRAAFDVAAQATPEECFRGLRCLQAC